MQESTLKNLILEDEDYIFAGDLTIEGSVVINNGSLIVSGTLLFSGEDVAISINGGDIAAQNLISRSTINIKDGDILVQNLHTLDILSDGNIEVMKDACVNNVTCLNYLISGDNDSYHITATEDIYILGINDSKNLKARDILIGGYSNFYESSGVVAKSFMCCGVIDSCCYILVG